ncbi:NAD-dependent phenylacetaldehyde dehydrogenase [Marinomonas sp. CT5]|uniref:NAD-dependent phenylacetaldehyde dehydrogenase n=1 Tax=Marinomonas sp. CT5 TaxID=2066133 RepID=UPI001BAF4326|nr:NAD-dependent phenylacetaldehyde dehydrogenase [Marinomonas sp. CT5]QUX96459.1 NAD-dependent phenylacetaldehyde dehydrogenase [Marinomonas sp. CT5]
MSDISLLDATQAFLKQDHGQFINGQKNASGDSTFNVINPSTEAVIANIHSATTQEVDTAIESSYQAFKGAWGKTSPYTRGVVLNKLADLIEQNGEEIAQLETLCSGKSIHLSRMFEVQQSAMFLRYFAGWSTKINGETMTPSFPSMQGEEYSAFTRREAIGVVAGILPWNFSVMIACWKIGAALCTGCTIVLKPSEFTPLTILRIAELAKEAGVPDGVLNIVNGKGDVGGQLIQHPKVRKVSFTGSVATGKKISAAASADLTRCTLELGGKNTAAILKDADIDRVVGGLFQLGYIHQGQVCAAPERVYVHSSRIDELTTKLAQTLSEAKIGSPLDESVYFGPLSNEPQFNKVCEYLEVAHKESRVLHGGKAISGKGFFVEPTIVQASSVDETLMQEETFGPIISFMPYEDEEELIDLINNTPFGLSSSIWTNNLSQAMRMIPKIESGTVWVNMHSILDPSVPFGGTKQSGVGREFGREFINDYTEVKSVIMCY